MTASLRIPLLLFSTFPAQRWLNTAGAVALIAAPFMPRAPALGCLLWGLIFLLAPPIVTSGGILRAISARRTLRLAPFGRLQVLLGMILTTVLIASVTTTVAAMVGVHDLLHISVPLLFARIETVATLLLIGLFLSTRSIARAALIIFVLAVTSALFASQSERITVEFVSNIGAATTLAVGVTAWILFGFWYLLAPTILPADADGALSPEWLLRAGSSRDVAIRASLTGYASMVGPVAGGLVAAVLMLAAWMLSQSAFTSDALASALVRSIGQCFGLSALAAAGAFTIAKRSRALWLKAGLSRSELLGLCEKHAWRHFGAAVTPLPVLLYIAWRVAPGQGSLLLALLVFHLALGACVLYLGLMHVRGWRAADLLAAGAIGFSWTTMMSRSTTLSDPQLVLLFAVAAMVLAGILRAAGTHRWRHLDWLAHRTSGQISQRLELGGWLRPRI